VLLVVKLKKTTTKNTKETTKEHKGKNLKFFTLGTAKSGYSLKSSSVDIVVQIGIVFAKNRSFLIIGSESELG
jgi:hypothetical protein